MLLLLAWLGTAFAGSWQPYGYIEDASGERRIDVEYRYSSDEDDFYIKMTPHGFSSKLRGYVETDALCLRPKTGATYWDKATRPITIRRKILTWKAEVCDDGIVEAIRILVLES